MNRIEDMGALGLNSQNWCKDDFDSYIKRLAYIDLWAELKEHGKSIYDNPIEHLRQRFRVHYEKQHNRVYWLCLDRWHKGKVPRSVRSVVFLCFYDCFKLPGRFYRKQDKIVNYGIGKTVKISRYAVIIHRGVVMNVIDLQKKCDIAGYIVAYRTANQHQLTTSQHSAIAIR